MNQRLATITSLFLGLTSIVGAQSLSVQDRHFVHEAAMGGMAEVRMGNIAAMQGRSARVKRFGRRMVADHSKANQQLMRVARRLNLPVPSSIGGEEAETLGKLSSRHGREFDSLYASTMVKDHRKDIAAFEDEAKNGRNPRIRNFARMALPTLRMHLKMAQRLP